MVWRGVAAILCWRRLRMGISLKEFRRRKGQVAALLALIERLRADALRAGRKNRVRGKWVEYILSGLDDVVGIACADVGIETARVLDKSEGLVVGIAIEGSPEYVYAKDRLARKVWCRIKLDWVQPEYCLLPENKDRAAVYAIQGRG